MAIQRPTTQKTQAPTATNIDEALDTTLRPQELSDYTGQTHIISPLEISITAAKQRGDALEHILLYGPPGLGKTTLASIIAREMKSNIRITSGPALEKSGDIAALLSNLQSGDILFIDEIHRLKLPLEEMLYTAMEDYALDLMVGKGPGARSMRLKLPSFTLIGATTQAGLLSSPLRDRFGSVYKLQFYTPKEMEKIIFRSANLLQTTLDQSACEYLSVVCRATPRIANRLLKNIRDRAQVQKLSTVSVNDVTTVLQDIGIDAHGLDHADREILHALYHTFQGQPTGLTTLATALSENTNTIEQVVEPYLIQQGFIQKTPRGRMITEKGIQAIL